MISDTGLRSKFLSLIFIDLVIMNAIEYARPLTLLWCKKHIRKMQGKGGDEADRVSVAMSELCHGRECMVMMMVVILLQNTISADDLKKVCY